MTPPLIRFSPQAVTEQLSIADYLNARSPGLGVDFLVRVAVTAARLARSPELGEFADGWAGRGSPIRRWPVERFVRHQLFYR